MDTAKGNILKDAEMKISLFLISQCTLVCAQMVELDSSTLKTSELYIIT